MLARAAYTLRVKSRRERIENGRAASVCPQCGSNLGERRIGTGSFADGIFCRLECLVTFHGDHFRERAQAASHSPN
jgi:ribosomal protein L37AE/L43A